MHPVFDPMIFFWPAFASFLFLIVSVLMGGHHGHGHGHGGHFGADHGHGHGGHGHGDHGGQHNDTVKVGNMSPVSLQTILLFIMGVSSAGYFADILLLSSLLVVGIAFLGGSTFSGLGYTLLNYLHKHQGSWHTFTIEDAIGQTGTVLVSIPANGRGKIACQIGGHNQSFSAVSQGEAIPVHAQVQVTGISGSAVLVELLALNPGNQLQIPSWRQPDNE